MTAKEKEKECDRHIFLLPNTNRFRAVAIKRKETARDGVVLVSSLCLFLAAALLPSIDRKRGVEG